MLYRLKMIIITVSLAGFVAACSKTMPADKPQPENTNSAPVAEQTNANTQPPAPAQPQKTARPLIRQGTIGLEGNEEKMTFKLFDSLKNSLTVPFTTYVPEDMVAQPARTDEGDGVTFFANFDGKRNSNAYLQVSILREGISEERARQTIEALARSRGLQERSSDAQKRFKWSLVERDFMNQTKSGEWLMGTVALGKHSDRFYYVMIQYPEEYEEGFVPRAYRILDEWRWEDTDTGL